MEKYQIRNMLRKELSLAVDWANKEGWNPGIYDAECFWAQDSKGFFVGTLGDEVVATVSAVCYSDEYGFMGFYIVKKEYRGMGYGMRLFRRAWYYLGDRNKGGDGVLENLGKYAKVGLKLAHYNARYGGKGFGGKKLSGGVRLASTLSFKDIFEYDRLVFGFPRQNFLKLWLTRPGTVAVAADDRGRVSGYGVVRKCYHGYKIGPLFADGDTEARNIFNSLIEQVPVTEEVFFDPPEVNEFAVKLAQDAGMKKVFATGRIYTKGQPDFPLKNWYGVTSFELG